MSTTTVERRPLTARQLDVLHWIVGFADSHGYPPTIREIGHAYGWTTNGVKSHLEAMRKKGWVSWVDGHSRTLRVLEVPHDG